jgi:hypothetical protein
MKEAPTLQNFKTDYDALKHLVPQIGEEELSFVWITGFYDGPLEGVVAYKGQKMWCEIVSDFVSQRTRYFALVALSDEEYKQEWYWHNRFEKSLSRGGSEEQALEWDNTYGVYQKQRVVAYRSKPVAAWFYTG